MDLEMAYLWSLEGIMTRCQTPIIQVQREDRHVNGNGSDGLEDGSNQLFHEII